MSNNDTRIWCPTKRHHKEKEDLWCHDSCFKGGKRPTTTLVGEERRKKNSRDNPVIYAPCWRHAKTGEATGMCETHWANFDQNGNETNVGDLVPPTRKTNLFNRWQETHHWGFSCVCVRSKCTHIFNKKKGGWGVRRLGGGKEMSLNRSHQTNPLKGNDFVDQTEWMDRFCGRIQWPCLNDGQKNA